MSEFEKDMDLREEQVRSMFKVGQHPVLSIFGQLKDKIDAYNTSFKGNLQSAGFDL